VGEAAAELLTGKCRSSTTEEPQLSPIYAKPPSMTTKARAVNLILQAAVRMIVVMVAARMLAFSGTICAAAPGGAVAGSTAVVEGKNGNLFLADELRFLNFPSFWGTASAKAAHSSKPEFFDPLPAIFDFHRQLQERGIALLLVPVPPKVAVVDRALADGLDGVRTNSLSKFYEQLQAGGVEVLDLWETLAAQQEAGESMYCKTDSHWSGAGCVTAAQAVAKRIVNTLPALERKHLDLQVKWEERVIRGDLAELLAAGKPEAESVRVRRITGRAIKSDPKSPVLIIGDSHTLVFHDFLGDAAGFPDQLAFELDLAPEWIGTRGSAANAVRLSLLRRATREADYLSGKKVIVWLFAAREFTEADQGWQKIPLSVLGGRGK